MDGMPKRDTLTLLDDLKKLGLDDPLFSTRLHHLGDSMKGFRAFCERVNSFRSAGCNQLLHDRMAYIRARCKDGALNGGRTIEDLVDEAKSQISRANYPACKKHISDYL